MAGPTGAPKAADTLEYLAELATGAASMARQSGQPFLAFLFDVAAASAAEGGGSQNTQPSSPAAELTEALKRARFLLASPAVSHLTNGAGTLDVIDAVIARAEASRG